MNKSIIFLFLILISISFTSATCIVTFDKQIPTQYAPTEDISAASICDNKNEEADAYTLTWVNSSGDTVQTNTGTTPAVKNTYFYEDYKIPSTYLGNITATLTGTDLEGDDIANVSGASSSSLIISDATVGGKWLGLASSIQATVKDSSDKLVSGGQCVISVWSNDETTMVKRVEAILIGGEVKGTWISGYDSFAEGTDYAVKIRCMCGSDGSSNECVDEEGTTVEDASGVTTHAFTTNSWISVRQNPLPITYENGTAYPTTTTSLFAGYDNVYIRRNITNNYGVTLESDIELHLVNNGTGQIYPVPQTLRTDISTGNSSIILEYVLPKDIDTGVYYVRAIADIYYYGLFTVRKIVSSDTFNVTSIEDTMTINSITIKDYWGNTVNTSATLLSDSSMPTSNWTDPYTVLTEGFGYQICGNITNSYSKDIYWHMENLVIHNPTTGWSDEEFNSEGERWQRSLKSGENDICWYSNIPLTIPTHSDYHFDFNIYIGDESEPFICGDKCEFSGETNYVYIGAIEDSIVFDKWFTKPNSTDDGVPLTFIVTEREEYLTMNDDCNYTDQETTDWGNASNICTPKDGGTQIHQNLSVYPRAGERFKVCFQTQNWLSNEIDLEFYDFYIDSDAGETVIDFNGDYSNGYVPSIQEDKLWESETPSRALELDGNLIDGYGIMCSHWMTLPNNVQGGNNWDIQGKVRINSDIYNLEEEVIWNWETDEFPIFGAREDEDFMRLIDITNVTTSAYGGSITACEEITVNFTYDYFGYEESVYIIEYCFEQTDDDAIAKCFNKKINPDVGENKIISDILKLPYFSSGGNAEVEIKIYDLNLETRLGHGDTEPYNTFTIVADTSDSCKYSEDLTQELRLRDSEALEGLNDSNYDQAQYLGGINASAGTFDFSISVPNAPTGQVLVSGFGITGNGQVLNRDVEIECYVENYQLQTSKKFYTYVTNNFSFSELVNVPDAAMTYNMICTAEDSKFGRYITPPVSTSFNRLPGGTSAGGAGGFIKEIIEKITPDVIEEFIDDQKGLSIFLVSMIMIVTCLIIFYKRKGRKECEEEEKITP